MSLNPGDLIEEKYRIVRLIGEGGMGAVYEGENVRIRRRVAIKVLHQNVASTPEVVARFEREAQAAGRIGSEHIVEVLDLGTLASGDRYMVMEFMDGDNLSRRIRDRGRMSPAEIYPLIRQLLDALAAAHNAGIVHRDLKPDNVFLLKSRRGSVDFVKLLDFGISKFSGTNAAFSMTRTGAVMGTPYYMAPEQARGARDLDHRVDLYAVGVILYEAVAGQVPFQADTFNELLFKIALETPRPLAEVVPNIDPVFAGIVTKSMLREPGQRYQTAEELQQALDQWAQSAGAIMGTGAHPALSVAAASALVSGTPVLAGTAPGPGAPQLGSQLGMTPGTWSENRGTTTGPAKPKSKAALFIGAAAGAIAVIGVAIAVVASKSGAASQSGTVASAVPTNTAPSMPVAAAQPAATAAPTATTTTTTTATATATVQAAPVAENPTAAAVPAPATSASSRTQANTAPRLNTSSAATKAVAATPKHTSPTVAAPAPPPAPAKTEPVQSGRRIRKTL